MADKLTPGTDVTRDHNVKARAEIINECANAALNIKKQRQELNEDMAAIRKRLKDAGINVAAFEFACRVKEMEQAARDEYIDGLRENFRALGVGQQGSLFPDLPQSPAASAPSSEGQDGGADGPEAVVEAGRNAYHAGTRYDQNPWPSSMANHELWANGWKQAEEATAMEMGGDGPGEPAEDEAGGRKARRRAA